jgi:hypothetical protein
MFDTDGEQAFPTAAEYLLGSVSGGEPLSWESVRAALLYSISSHVVEGRCEVEGSNEQQLVRHGILEIFAGGHFTDRSLAVGQVRQLDYCAPTQLRWRRYAG